MTSTVKVNTLTVASGCTMTLGESGKTVALASGASQTGFGRNGSVNWQTTIKTGDFTAVSGEGYFVNTTSGEIDVTLPSSPSVGDIVAVSDYAKTFATNNCIMLRNSSNIEGAASNLTLDAEGLAMTFVYADATKGWKVVDAGRQADSTAKTFIVGTGGTITTDGDYKVHSFTGPGTFTVCSLGNASTVGDKVEYLVVAGGGGGGGGYQSGGGGAGGYRESPGTVAGGSYTVSPRGAAPAAAVTVTAQGYPIVVGGGGPAGPATPSPGGPNHGQKGTQGNTSSALGISSAGGGYGGGFGDGSPGPGLEEGGDGGSGGGSGRSPGTNPGGTGNTPPLNPVQGTNGGNTTTPYTAPYSGGAGGGALTVGGPGQGSCFGVGGNGATSAINATPTARAGGGGGGSGSASPGAATGGPGGGGNGGWGPGSGGDGIAATVNTGGGGGGAGYCGRAGGNGGSGIVVIRYKYQ